MELNLLIGWPFGLIGGGPKISETLFPGGIGLGALPALGIHIKPLDLPGDGHLINPAAAPEEFPADEGIHALPERRPVG